MSRARAESRRASPSGSYRALRPGDFWELRLYVAGRTPRAESALANLSRACELHLPGQYAVEVIDLLEDPGRAVVDQIVALPTLVRRLPTPIKKIIGDLSSLERVLVGLELEAGSGAVAMKRADEDAPGGNAAGEAEPEYLLRLFVAGLTARSQLAMRNLQALCDSHLAGRYRIEVVDLHQSPELARMQQILATPTLVKVRPSPTCRVIGDLSHLDTVLHRLEIP